MSQSCFLLVLRNGCYPLVQSKADTTISLQLDKLPRVIPKIIPKIYIIPNNHTCYKVKYKKFLKQEYFRFQINLSSFCSLWISLHWQHTRLKLPQCQGIIAKPITNPRRIDSGKINTEQSRANQFSLQSFPHPNNSHC